MQDLKALIIDNDIKSYELIKLTLESKEFECFYAQDLEGALKNLVKNEPHFIILSFDMPENLGRAILYKIRRVSNIPLIVISSDAAPFDKIEALSDGADEYIIKPFESEELYAYIKALLRRSLNMPIIDFYNDFNKNGLFVSIKKYEVFLNGEKIDTAPKETELLHYLATRNGNVVSKERIFERIWGTDCKSKIRTVDVHIKFLRDKLKGSWQIKNIHGTGYKLVFIDNNLII